MLGFYVVALVFVVGFLGLFVGLYLTFDDTKGRQAQAKATKLQTVQGIDGFEPAITWAGLPHSYGLAMDPASEKFAIIMPEGPPRLYHFTQLMAAEIDRNGRTYTTTEGQIQTGRAALATALAGPVGGLLVGAKTSSSSVSTEEVALTLKVYVNDLHTPCFAIPFGGGMDDGTGRLDGTVALIDAWFGRFKTILVGLEGQRGKKPHPKAITNPPPPPAVEKGWWGTVLTD